jgi:class 3 adenylate cyclase/ribosomal protein L40E
MHCANCGSQNPDGAKFCNECGVPLALICPTCGTKNSTGAKFCHECGTSLAGPSRVQGLESRVQKTSGVGPRTSDMSPQTPDTRRQTLDVAGERRQLTVMFCDLVDSAALSEQLDPEEYREVVHTYQQTSAAVIERFDGYIAQYLGDGLLVYFGYPQAHEDDAARAVRAGLEITAAIAKLLPSPLAGEHVLRASEGGQGEGVNERVLRVRIGIHTGPVVISEIGSPARHEQLALGETPNIAARVQGQAAPNAVVISATTYQLVQGLFECQELDARPLKGLSTPLSLYQTVREATAHSRFEVAVQRGLTPLVGREHEVGLLSERWERAKQAEGQVVLLSGEPGIVKIPPR